MTAHIGIIDYGSGNLRSAAKAFEKVMNDNGIKGTVEVFQNPAKVASYSHLVLPGVGAFADCMQGLLALPGMVEHMQRHIVEAKKPFLGICVGMQLLMQKGFEHGEHKGLGWFEGEVRAISPASAALKVPHMGWNALHITSPIPHPVLRDIKEGDHAYFVHSYHCVCTHKQDIAATVDYGQKMVAVIAKETIVATQFHPEKSQETGLRLLANFVQWRP